YPLRWLVGPRNRRRFRHRRALGDRPVLWKELYTGGARGLSRFIAFLLSVIGGGYLAYWAVWYGTNAIHELWDQGYSLPWSYASQPDRWEFYWFLVTIVPLIYLVGILAVAGAAASSITSEHEKDTWISLTVTDLTAREIILGKLFGTLTRGRRFAE